MAKEKKNCWICGLHKNITEQHHIRQRNTMKKDLEKYKMTKTALV